MGDEAEKKKYEWLYGDQSKIQSNSQSKFLTGKINIDKFNEGMSYLQNNVNHNWYIEDYSLDLDNVLLNVDKFYCYTLENQKNFVEDFNKSLYKNFGFTTFKNNYKANCSPDIGITFSKQDVDRIIELNELDMQVYEYVQKSKKRF